MNESSDKVRVEYIKSNSFHVVHADGAYGGVSPRLGLFISFYSERFPIPKVLTYEAASSGALGEEVRTERETKTGIIREVEVGVALDFAAAKALASWLNDKVAELEKVRQEKLTPDQQHQEIRK